MHVNTLNDSFELLSQFHPGSRNESLHFIAYQEGVSLPHPDHVARNIFKDVESDHLWNCAD